MRKRKQGHGREAQDGDAGEKEASLAAKRRKAVKSPPQEQTRSMTTRRDAAEGGAAASPLPPAAAAPAAVDAGRAESDSDSPAGSSKQPKSSQCDGSNVQRDSADAAHGGKASARVTGCLYSRSPLPL